ncbi:ParA family protein [Halothiobacillus diazotrophicus]|uniref:ParA family protein n=1 Tax=Halothiobacillus diazotrophicus TaxID=1860122 RepID=UPI0009EE0B57|nr:ParA family protein [Halothiobacillus diazotrophicus]
MNIWAVANQKGGVGKTTTSVTLAGHLAQRGQRVLLIDIDPHGSMTTYFGMEPDAPGASVYSLFKAASEGRVLNPMRIIHPTAFESISLMPASTALATLDRQLGKQDGMGLVLKRALSTLTDQFDAVIIDCPPILGVTMVNALAAAHFLLIPVQTEFLALKGLERMLRTLTMVQRSRKFRLEYLIVPTMYDQRTRASRDTLQTLRDQYFGTVWTDVIPIDTLFREASRLGKPLSFLQPESRGSHAYAALLDWLLPHQRQSENMSKPAAGGQELDDHADSQVLGSTRSRVVEEILR